MLLPDIPQAAVWAIYFAPLISFIVIVAALHRRPLLAGRVTIAAVGIAWVLALWALDTAIGLHGEPAAFSPHHWFSLFDLNVEFGVRLDGLSAVMIATVTTISLLMQIYSTGYMKDDGGYSRFFAYMSLFTMSMLGVVMASSLLQLYIHWELVGLTSYLLIGFWFDRPSAAAAAKKAFIVTRFGDFAFLVAVVLMWSKGHTFDIEALNGLAHSGALSQAVLAGFVLGLFSGAAGKSAQFPLHFWLPDAMEGPTPVSAIVHSATMVAAGVYLMARFFPTVMAAPVEVRDTIAYIGGFTAIFAASMGIVATDIKRVLAYSTISQLGYMVMAIGLGGYVAAIFHLFTHAFFKSMLFQGAGSVSHGTNTFEMPLMGGLRRAMPITFATFVVGALSLSGIFPLAGFWSKDEILLTAWDHNKLLWLVGTVVAFMTALYMFRAIFMTFFGDYRGGAAPAGGHGDGHAHAPHESPVSMVFPLVALSVGAALFGFFAIGGRFSEFVEGALIPSLREGATHSSTLVLLASTVAALGGIGVAAAIYYAQRPRSADVRAALGPLPPVVERLYYVNEIAEGGVIRGLLQSVIGRAAAAFDRYVVDGVVNGVGMATRLVGDGLRRSETGQLQAYTSLYVIGVVVAISVLFALSGGVLDRLMP